MGNSREKSNNVSIVSCEKLSESKYSAMIEKYKNATVYKSINNYLIRKIFKYGEENINFKIHRSDKMYYNLSEEERFKEEINKIIENIEDNEIAIIIKECFTQALKVTFDSKKVALKNAGKSILKVGKNATKIFKNEINYIKIYRKEYVSNMFPRLKDLSLDTRDNIMEAIDGKIKMFKTMPMNEKKGILISGMIWAATVLAAGGGMDFEGGIPDLDIKIGGVGSHRNVFSHTILVGLCLEFFLRLLIRLSKYGKEYLPIEKSEFWKYIEKLATIIDENENVLISGMWVGLSIHLLKDASLFNSKTKPYVGMKRKIGMQGHQNIFAGNSFLSFLFGGKSE